jgi:hypothetical protein
LKFTQAGEAGLASQQRGGDQDEREHSHAYLRFEVMTLQPGDPLPVKSGYDGPGGSRSHFQPSTRARHL